MDAAVATIRWRGASAHRRGRLGSRLRPLIGMAAAAGVLLTVASLLAPPASADSGGPVRALLPPVTVPGREAAMGAVPALGQHTEAVLAEFLPGRTS